MSSAPFSVYMIAGEASGDDLGAVIMDGITAGATNRRRDVRFRGVGGTKMSAYGLRSLFPQDDLAVAGIGPIVARLPTLLRRIRETADDVCASAPDVLITIDSPDFCYRVAKRVRARRPGQKIVHVVAPTVWAWRPGRAKKWGNVVDGILALFPFEPDVMARLGGPETVYIGHPLAAAAGMRPTVGAFDENARDTVLLLPGSRRQELHAHLPLFRDTLHRTPNIEGRRLSIVTLPHRAAWVAAETRSWPWSVEVVSDEVSKQAAFDRAWVALAASGTVTLEIALRGVPMVITYRTSALWRVLAKHYGVKHVGLPNIIAGREIVPECLFGNAQAEVIAPALSDLISNRDGKRTAQLSALEDMTRRMGVDSPPSIIAADYIFSQ